MRVWRRAPVLVAATLAACSEAEQNPPATDSPTAGSAVVGRCAVHPLNGSLIGVIVRPGTDPETGEPSYVVRLETDPGQVGHVPQGVRVMDCMALRAEEREPNPDPVSPPPTDTTSPDRSR